MKGFPEYIAKVAFLNGGSVVGKTRVQKTLYFLEECGIGNGFDFEYYFYGPYSEEASVAIDDAAALGYVEQDWKYTKAGAKYAVIRSAMSFDQDEVDLRRRRILKILADFDSISIELAATADYLEKNGYEVDPWLEVVARKSEKAKPDAIDKAKRLLERLHGAGTA